MPAYRSLILHHVRIGSAPAATIFALRMAARIRAANTKGATRNNWPARLMKVKVR